MIDQQITRTKSGPRIGCVEWILCGMFLTGIPNARGQAADSWSGFRGAYHNGVIPLTSFRDGQENRKVAWNASLQGLGQSSLVIHSGHVMATSITGDRKEWLHVEAYSISDGQRIWHFQHPSTHPEERSSTVSIAAPTPCLDESGIYALFESGDLIKVDHQGQMVWKLNLQDLYGRFVTNHGQGASPVLSSHGVVVTMDHSGQSYIASFDKSSGEIQWMTPKESGPAWSSPVRVVNDQKESILTSASGRVSSYDPQTGKMLWEYDKISGNTIPSPCVSGQLVALSSSRKNNTMLLDLAHGTPKLLWKSKDVVSDFCSPAFFNHQVWLVSKSGIVHALNRDSGSVEFEKRLDQPVWASPISFEDSIWFFTKAAEVHKFSRNSQREITHTLWNPVPEFNGDREQAIYGVGFSQNKIFVRSTKNLICLVP